MLSAFFLFTERYGMAKGGSGNSTLNGERANGQKKEKEFRDKVNDAQTKEELLTVLREQYGAENVAKGFVEQHDLGMTKKAVNTLLELEDRYPFMKGAISGFHVVVDPTTVFDPNGSISAQTITDFGGRTGKMRQTLGLGAAFATENNPLLFSGSERGQQPPNMTPEAVIAHEFGHAMHNYLLGRMLQEARQRGVANAFLVMDDIKRGTTLQRLEQQAKRSLGRRNGLPNFRAEISKYASGAKAYGGNPTKESFADAFADVYANGDRASEVSKAYVNALLNEINRLGYGE